MFHKISMVMLCHVSSHCRISKLWCFADICSWPMALWDMKKNRNTRTGHPHLMCLLYSFMVLCFFCFSIHSGRATELRPHTILIKSRFPEKGVPQSSSILGYHYLKKSPTTWVFTWGWSPACFMAAWGPCQQLHPQRRFTQRLRCCPGEV